MRRSFQRRRQEGAKGQELLERERRRTRPERIFVQEVVWLGNAREERTERLHRRDEGLRTREVGQERMGHAECR